MKPIHRTALASAIALGLAAPAYAAPQADATELEQIVVTGTRAKDRTVLESAVPIDVITRDDLRRAGAVGQELGQVLQNLLPTFNFPRQSNSGGADHVRAGQLRGLSPDQVLVLVNGKRRHTSAIVNLEAKIGKGTNPVDFNSIPLGAIARIEVLRDGAGAQYGSDAIAGVINIILDDAPAGGEVGFTYGAHRTDFEPTDDTLTDGQTRSFDAEIGIPLSERGFLRFGLDYTDRAQTERGGPDGIPFFEEQTPANLALAGRVNYRPGDPAVTAYNGWFNGLLPVGEAFDLYAFGTYNDRESEGAAFFRYPDSSQNFRSVYPQGYRPFTTGDNSDTAATVGARGSGSAWSWDASLGFGRNAFDFGVANSLNAS
ncbi:MAG: TonB-dependent receptor plug domain-containing protein, partial [Pseudomonadota bacterium]